MATNAGGPMALEQRLADKIVQAFDAFYREFLAIPGKAKLAFEQRDHAQSLRLSAQRLQLYSKSVGRLTEELKSFAGTIFGHKSNWIGVERIYRTLIAGRYAEDLALAYCHSLRRYIYHGEWRAEDYSYYQSAHQLDCRTSEYIAVYPVTGALDISVIREILNQENFSIPYKDGARDARLIRERAAANFRFAQDDARRIESIEMFRAGFYRNRGAYLVGRADFGTGRYAPFIIALLNDGDGIYVDALITSSTYAHNMFSSTLANFHVTNTYYHELCQFLKSFMPMRPLGLHYSTIGYNHLGKVAVMNELENELLTSGQRLTDAVGAEGTVAIAFSAPNSVYCLKVIRDQPTKHYKWGEFEGVDSVLGKYARVHDINRSDSMLDAIIYYNLRIATDWFEPRVLDKLLRHAGQTVTEHGDAVVFRYLIVQRKLTPLPVFLENAGRRQAETVIKNLGYCIKNNAAANIFNKDLDARNYGVTSYSKVYLYDYDALEVLTDVKIRTNLDRVDGEEDIPDWYFEDGVVFLPEEIVTGLRLPFRDLRRLFSNTHGELLTVEYWRSIQQELAAKVVPRVSVYPDSEKLAH